MKPQISAATLLQHAPRPAARREWSTQAVALALPLLAVTALALAWSFNAPLAGAVVASGHVKAELNRKTVQHQEGGILREILVRDGQQVRAGEPLLVIGNVRSDAELSMLRDQWQDERLHAARAAAEAALASRFEPPADLAEGPAAAEQLERQRALLAAHRRTLDEQIAALQAQVQDTRSQALALTTQIAATERSAGLAAQELAIHEPLVAQGYIHRTKLLAMQREASDYGARIGEQRSDLAVAHQRESELQSRIVQARNQYRQQAADELKVAEARLRELQERLRPSADQVERQQVRSPVDGIVMDLRVSSAGEVIGPREPLLDVVPANERLVVEARIRPEDIAHVQRGAGAELRFSAFDARSTPPLPARIAFVSPDRMTRADSGEAWFVATAEVDAAALREHPSLRLQAGMPAELYVTTPERTLVQYLAKPLGLFASRAMREP